MKLKIAFAIVNFAINQMCPWVCPCGKRNFASTIFANCLESHEIRKICYDPKNPCYTANACFLGVHFSINTQCFPKLLF